MRNKLSASWLPACAFVAAALLSYFSNTRTVALGRAQAAPTCQVSASLVGIGGSATNGNFNLNNVQIASSNNKNATLKGKCTAVVDLTMSGVDTNGKTFSLSPVPTLITFTPTISKNYAPGNRTDQFASESTAATTLFEDGKTNAKELLGKRKVKSWDPLNIPAQPVVVQVNGTINCKGEPVTQGIANGLTVTLNVNANGTAPVTNAGIGP